MSAADDCARRVRALYGDALAEGRDLAPRVLHVASAWQDGADRLRAIRIGAHAPRSESDRFALGVARARADAIVTTGRILREEPALRLALGADAGTTRMLRAWREERLGRSARPRCVVLSSGSDLDFTHPIFEPSDEGRDLAPILVTGVEAAARLAPKAVAAGVEIVDCATPSLRTVLELLAERFAARTISIEAGPATSREIYEPPLAVDELMLSIYRGPLSDSAKGGAFVSPARIEAALGGARSAARVEEGSGSWQLLRYWRMRA